MNKRPIIIFILAIILVLTGIFYIFFAGKLIKNSFTYPILIGGSGIFYLTTGIGLLLRKKWGWWLAVLFSMYGVLGFFDNYKLINIFDYVTETPLLTPSDIFKSFIESVIYIGLTLYFLKRSILSYFDIVRISKTNFIILICVAIIIKVGYYYI